MAVKWGPPIEGFDCVEWTRETRDRVYEETKGMSLEERRRWREAKLRPHPGLAAILDRCRPPGQVSSTQVSSTQGGPPRPAPDPGTRDDQ